MLQLLRAIALVLLLCSPSWAAFASVGNICSGSSTTAGLTLTCTAAAQLDTGNLGVLLIALDNTSTTNGNTTEVSTVVDNALNTWTKIREFCNGQGTAATGATVSVWYTIASANLPITTGIITITFANTITSKAAKVWEFTDRKSTRLNSSHIQKSRMPSSA